MDDGIYKQNLLLLLMLRLMQGRAQLFFESIITQKWLPISYVVLLRVPMCTYDFYERLMEKNANCHTSIVNFSLASLIGFKMWIWPPKNTYYLFQNDLMSSNAIGKSEYTISSCQHHHNQKQMLINS